VPKARKTPTSWNVNHVAVLIDRTPQIVALPADRDEDLVQKPGVSESTLPLPKLGRVRRPELDAPVPDRLVRDGHTSLRQEILDVAEAQAEAVI